MILPKKVIKKEPPSKYAATSVKMFVTALDDVNTNRYKSGWFTLLKFTEQVKLKPDLIDEMRLFGQTKLDKPVVQVHQAVKSQVKAKKILPKLNLKIGLEDESNEPPI